MARPREFDRDDALDAALRVFWRHGYTASSLEMLLEAMHLKRGSFYAAFGSKSELFREVMARYQDRMQSLVVSLLESPDDPAHAVHQVFELTLLKLSPAQRELGCLLVNTVNELAPWDEQLASDAARRLAAVEQAFAGACERASERGQIRADLSPKTGARLLMTAMTGLRVQARQGMSQAQLRQGIAPLLAMLFPDN